jgi:hypothetical protein
MCSLVSQRANLSRVNLDWQRNGHTYTMRIGEWITSKREIANAIFPNRQNLIAQKQSVLRFLHHMTDWGWLTVEALENRNDGLRLTLTIPTPFAYHLSRATSEDNKNSASIDDSKNENDESVSPLSFRVSPGVSPTKPLSVSPEGPIKTNTDAGFGDIDDSEPCHHKNAYTGCNAYHRKLERSAGKGIEQEEELDRDYREEQDRKADK